MKWRLLDNFAAEMEDSIHDDDRARALGFRGGFVPGGTVGTAAMPAVIDRFGAQWFEGGWHTLKFVSPVYIDEEVREFGQPVEGSDTLAVRIETREGRLCCAGRAGLGTEPPWDTALDGTRGAEQVLPEVPMGAAYPKQGDDGSTGRRPPPLGRRAGNVPVVPHDLPAGIVPPEHLIHMGAALGRGRRFELTGTRPPGIWTQHEALVLRPLHYDTPYRVRGAIVDKGRSGRTVFYTIGFDILATTGESLAQGRVQTKWFAED